jgi:hypothetical protein
VKPHLAVDNTHVPSTHARVMHWPAHTCYPSCCHQDCERRRREIRVPCSVCGGRISRGQFYKVTATVAGEIVSQAHTDCLGGERWR